MTRKENHAEESSYRKVVEAILASGTITEEDARRIYALGSDAVVFALLAMKAQQHIAPASGLSQPSATIPPYEKPSKKSSRKKKPGRKPGFKGTSRKTPERIDREQTHTLTECPDCGGAVSQEKTPRVRVIEDLPESSTSEVTKHTIYRAWCATCRKKVEPVVTDALPNSQIGLRLMAFTAWLHYALGTTISQILAILNHHLCMKLSAGSLTTCWQRLAEILQPWYEQIQKSIKNARVVHGDETSWRVNGVTYWIWCIASPTTTFYMIERSRGSPALLKFFTEAFAGTIVSDFWGAYNAVVASSRQMCLVHLLRELSSTTKYRSPRDDWPRFEKSLKRLLRDAIRLWYRKKDYKPQQYESRSNRLFLRLRLLCEHDWKDPNCKRLVKRLIRHEEHLFTFVNTDGVPFDNNHCEREIRSAVVMRKNSYGNRSLAGAETQAILMSVFRTLGKSALNPIQEVVDALKTFISTGKLPTMKIP
jgi:transposase